MMEEKPFAVTRVSLDATTMRMENGWMSIEPKMTVTGEIKTGRQTVISYLLSPLSRLRQEGLREMRRFVDETVVLKTKRRHVVLFSLVAFAHFVSGCEGDCEAPEQAASDTSPNKKVTFFLEHQVCAGGFGTGGESYWVELRKRNGTITNRERVYEQLSSGEPIISWNKNGDLDIRVTKVTEVSTSIRYALGIKIYYSVTKDITPDNYLRSVEISAKSTAMAINDGFATFSGKNKEDDLRLLELRTQDEKSNYAAFEKWAIDNGALPKR